MSKCTDHLENALSKPTKSEVRVPNIFEKQEKKQKKTVSVLKEKK